MIAAYQVRFDGLEDSMPEGARRTELLGKQSSHFQFNFKTGTTWNAFLGAFASIHQIIFILNFDLEGIRLSIHGSAIRRLWQ